MPKVWMIGVGREWSSYQELKARRVVAQGWSVTGDLTDLFRQPENTVEQDSRLADLDSTVGQRTLKNLLCHIVPGDVVIACEGKSVKGICEIGSAIDYGYDEKGTVSHVDPKDFWPEDQRFEYANVLFPVEWVDWDDFNKVSGRRPPGIGAGHLRMQRCWQDPEGILQAWTQYKVMLPPSIKVKGMRMPTVWKIGVGTTWSTYQELKARRVVAQGWSETGDLKGLFRQPENTVEQDPRLGDLGTKRHRTLKNLLCCILPGDLVIAYEGTLVMGICEIGPAIDYGYDEKGTVSQVDPIDFWSEEQRFEYANVLFPVEWVDWGDFNKVPRRQPPSAGRRGVPGIQCCRQDPEGILQKWTQYKGIPGPIPGSNGTQGKRTDMPEISLLKHFRQIILNGPPGTGKTYKAKRLAAELLFEGQSDERIQEYFEQEKKSGTGAFADRRFKVVRRENQSDAYEGQWAIVQFHPAYNYEDFVRGIQVSGQDGTIKYENVQRIFSAICTAAAQEAQNKYVLIIDEINRAHIAAVLGELIYGLEYRNAKITTPYAIEGDATLSVPDNLYIIGTMNTADRSIGHIDYAVRRRFAFVSCPPERDVLVHYYSKKAEELRELALQLFQVVGQIFKKENLNEFDADDVRPGHTYFMAEDTSALWNKFVYQVHPLLREYYKDGILKQAVKPLAFPNGDQVPLDRTVSAETWVKLFDTLQGTSAASVSGAQ